MKADLRSAVGYSYIKTTCFDGIAENGGMRINRRSLDIKEGYRRIFTYSYIFPSYVISCLIKWYRAPNMRFGIKNITTFCAQFNVGRGNGQNLTTS